jgi:AP-3 complex subunit beta
MSMQDFPEIGSLAAGASTQVLMGLDFNDSTQPAHLVLASGARRHNVSIAAPVGELLMPSTMTESDFKALAGNTQFHVLVALNL